MGFNIARPFQRKAEKLVGGVAFTQPGVYLCLKIFIYKPQQPDKQVGLLFKIVIEAAYGDSGGQTYFVDAESIEGHGGYKGDNGLYYFRAAAQLFFLDF